MLRSRVPVLIVLWLFGWSTADVLTDVAKGNEFVEQDYLVIKCSTMIELRDSISTIIRGREFNCTSEIDWQSDREFSVVVRCNQNRRDAQDFVLVLPRNRELSERAAVIFVPKLHQSTKSESTKPESTKPDSKCQIVDLVRIDDDRVAMSVEFESTTGFVYQTTRISFVLSRDPMQLGTLRVSRHQFFENCAWVSAVNWQEERTGKYEFGRNPNGRLRSQCRFENGRAWAAESDCEFAFPTIEMYDYYDWLVERTLGQPRFRYMRGLQPDTLTEFTSGRYGWQLTQISTSGEANADMSGEIRELTSDIDVLRPRAVVVDPRIHTLVASYKTVANGGTEGILKLSSLQSKDGCQLSQTRIELPEAVGTARYIEAVSSEGKFAVLGDLAGEARFLWNLDRNTVSELPPVGYKFEQQIPVALLNDGDYFTLDRVNLNIYLHSSSDPVASLFYGCLVNAL